ncbi:class F sortase [Streptomyces yaizuensis]|uniref:Class F sortase n=1 Tax=Streptomyces yaizuensis TaxID=2989713 RepID=A0ABQ5NUZ1_9ACTN|nr:class F sortase [Streptomyces sp. YSPA8]GLF93816.1 class F sortase [Streptomyces sp. YSPA8]
MSDKVTAWCVAVAVCTGLWLVRDGSRDHTPPAPSAAQALASGPHAWSGVSADPLPASPPHRLRIPYIDVDTPLMGLGLDRDGALEVPPADRRDLAGWYRGGAAPGALGTAVVAGHVDNARGPAVFHGLGVLRKGNRIEVSRADGTTAVFAVDAVEVHPADDFPDARVYGSRGRAELRLITCGGGFSRKTGYRGNVVAYAHLIGSRR